MAISKSTKASRNTDDKAKKPVSPKPTKSRAHEVIERLLEVQPALSAAQRGAFSARHTDAACEEMGGRTKSEGVLANALEWTGPMAKALKKHPQPLRRSVEATAQLFAGPGFRQATSSTSTSGTASTAAYDRRR
jgi:hypothetical protein